MEDHVGTERFRKDRSFTVPIGAVIGSAVGYLCAHLADGDGAEQASGAGKGAYVPVSTHAEDERLGSTI